MSDFQLLGRTSSIVGATVSSPVTREDAATVRKARRLPRSQNLVDSVRQIDLQTDPAMKQAIIKWVEDEYAKRGGGALVGLFSRCYLGDDFVDHHMTIAGQIVEHYRRADPVPVLYSMARPLAASAAYAYVEVYSDGDLVPVRNDGTV